MLSDLCPSVSGLSPLILFLCLKFWNEQQKAAVTRHPTINSEMVSVIVSPILELKPSIKIICKRVDNSQYSECPCADEGVDNSQEIIVNQLASQDL